MSYKSYLGLLLLVIFAICDPTVGTQGFYLSPHGLTRQRQVHDALQKISSNITVQRTTYNHGTATYTIDNTTLIIGFMDARQKIQIIADDDVQVSGGRIEIYYQFNWSKVDAGKTVNGYAHGSVMTDSVNYTKMLTFNHDGFLAWQLLPGNKSFTQLTIFDRMKIKRMQPFNETDLSALEQMLDRAIQGIAPSTIQHQILEKFNTLLPQALNTTLNTYILGRDIQYNYESTTKGKLTMNIVHHVFHFGVTPQDGFTVLYLTQIKDWPQPVCQGKSVPQKHLSWEFYGGSQNIHMICLYQQVIQYMQKKGWLDTKLDTSWDTNAFQFYAGDLYDLINNFYLSANPRQLVTGQCKATPNGLTIKHGRDMRHNLLAMDVQYACSAQTRDYNSKYIDVLNFTAEIKFYIQAKADKVFLEFSIVDTEVLSMQFKPVGNFYVNNINLAYFKTNQVLQKLKGMHVFGTGFPTLPRESPGSEATDDYVIYYDSSHRNSSGSTVKGMEL